MTEVIVEQLGYTGSVKKCVNIAVFFLKITLFSALALFWTIFDVLKGSFEVLIVSDWFHKAP